MSLDDVAPVVAVGLPGAPALATEPLDDERWLSLVTTAANERATGFLLHAVTTGALAATTAQHDSLQRVHELELADCLRLEAMLVTAGAELDREGIEWRLLKGPAFARRWYPAPDWRTFGDVDLLVRGRAWDAAAGYLGTRGFDRRYAEPRPGFTARFGKGACFVSPAGLEIDLHRTFVAGPFGLAFDADELFVDTEHIEIGGHRIPTLTAPAMAVHAAMHAVLGSERPRLVALRDLAQMLTNGVDAGDVRDRARAWRVGYPVARAVLRARAVLGLSEPLPLDAWAASYQPTRGERRALAVYASARRSYAAQALAGATAVRGVRARLAYVRALALPAPSYLDHRDGGARQRFVRAARLLGSWRAPR